MIQAGAVAQAREQNRAARDGGLWKFTPHVSQAVSRLECCCGDVASADDVDAVVGGTAEATASGGDDFDKGSPGNCPGRQHSSELGVAGLVAVRQDFAVRPPLHELLDWQRPVTSNDIGPAGQAVAGAPSETRADADGKYAPPSRERPVMRCPGGRVQHEPVALTMRGDQPPDGPASGGRQRVAVGRDGDSGGGV